MPGIIGRNCEIDIDECESNPCQHGTCHDEVNRIAIPNISFSLTFLNKISFILSYRINHEICRPHFVESIVEEMYYYFHCVRDVRQVVDRDDSHSRKKKKQNKI